MREPEKKSFNPFVAVDDFFAVFVDEEAGRFFLNVVFWVIAFIILWNVIEFTGLWLLWAAAVFAIIPFLTASMFVHFWQRSQEQDMGTGIGFFKFSLGLYVGSVLTLIGIPGWYFGLLLYAIHTETVLSVYWGVIHLWWMLFNSYHETTLREMKDFSDDYQFMPLTWQVCFLLSAAVIAPILFLLLRAKEEEQAKLDKAKHEAEVIEIERKREAAITRDLQIAERERLYEVRRQQERVAELEKQRKLEEKVKEVKGKDPWESGFL